jgi:hypothetical protein
MIFLYAAADLRLQGRILTAIYTRLFEPARGRAGVMAETRRPGQAWRDW